MPVTMSGHGKDTARDLQAGEPFLDHQRWIERICRDGRDREAESAIFFRYQPALVRIAASIVGESNAEDVVQDVFAKLLNGAKLQPFIERSESDLRNWLVRCARNECISFLRRPANRSKLSLTDHDAATDMATATVDHDPYEERRKIFRDCRQRLSSRQDQIIQLDLGGQTSEQIAAAMKITMNSVYKLRNAAMKALKLCTEGKLL